jgi:hypothetical protein
VIGYDLENGDDTAYGPDSSDVTSPGSESAPNDE